MRNSVIENEVVKKEGCACEEVLCSVITLPDWETISSAINEGKTDSMPAAYRETYRDSYSGSVIW